MGDDGRGMGDVVNSALSPIPHPSSRIPIPLPSRYRRVRQVRHRLRQLLHLRSIARALRVTLELRRELRERIVARRSRRTLSARDVLTNRRDAAGREAFAALELIDVRLDQR